MGLIDRAEKLADLKDSQPIKDAKKRPWTRPEDVDRKSSQTELLIPALETFLRNGYEDGPRDPGAHCSQMYSWCARRAILDVFFPEFAEEIVHEPRIQMIFHVGTALHHWFQEKYFGPQRVLWGEWECLLCAKRVTGFMPSQCRRCAAPRRVHVYHEPAVRFPELDLVGHCDGILALGGLRKVLEIKTINPKGFEEVLETASASASHIYQVNIYMHLLGLDSALIFYINKADNRLAEFDVPYDKRVWADVESKLGQFKVFKRTIARNGGQFDEHRFQSVRGICWSKDSWSAKQCPHRETCFKLKAGEEAAKPYKGISFLKENK